MQNNQPNSDKKEQIKVCEFWTGTNNLDHVFTSSACFIPLFEQSLSKTQQSETREALQKSCQLF